MRNFFVLSMAITFFVLQGSSFAATVTETSIPNVSWAGELAVDSSNNIWAVVTNSTDGKDYIVMFTPSTLKLTVYSTQLLNGRPVGIAIDSDGNLWMSDVNLHVIVRLNLTSNTTTTFPTPTPIPISIAADNNNNIWVGSRQRTLSVLNTTSETWTSYFVNTEINHIRYRDGAVWFTGAIPTGRAQGVIGKFNISTSSVTFFNTSSFTNFLNFDSRGNVWFSENRANLLGVLFTNGTIFEYTIPSAGTGMDSPYGVVVDIDDNVWYTERSGDNSTKAVSVFKNSTKTFETYVVDSLPYDVTTDILNNVWYVGAGSWKLGKLNLVTYVVKQENGLDVSITAPSQVVKGERFTQIAAVRNLLGREVNNITITLLIPRGMQTDLNSTRIFIEKLEPNSVYSFNFKTTATSAGPPIFRAFADSGSASARSFWLIRTVGAM